MLACSHLGFIQLDNDVHFRSCFVKSPATTEACPIGALLPALPCGKMPGNADIAVKMQLADTR